MVRMFSTDSREGEQSRGCACSWSGSGDFRSAGARDEWGLQLLVCQEFADLMAGCRDSHHRELGVDDCFSEMSSRV